MSYNTLKANILTSRHYLTINRGDFEPFLKHLDKSLLPGLSNKTAYRLNVTLMTLVTGTTITQKIFCNDQPYILSQKGFKVAPNSRPGWNRIVGTPNLHALNLHLQGLNVQSHLSLECLTDFKNFLSIYWLPKTFLQIDEANYINTAFFDKVTWRTKCARLNKQRFW